MVAAKFDVAQAPVLGPVQETLLIPLYGRALETQRATALLHDERAVEIVRQIDYDFAKWDRSPSLRGTCLRTRMYDTLVRDFLAESPNSTVIELGCGLNTRFDRVDNGMVRWFDLDLPDVIDLRRRFFEDSDRCRMLAASASDTDWFETVLASRGPYLFVSEAVLIYLYESDVRRTLTSIIDDFAPCSLILDTTSAAMVEGQATHDAMRHLPEDSWFRWKCDDPHVIEEWVPGLTLNRSLTFADADPDAVRLLPWSLRAMVRLFPGMMRRRVDGYRMNVLSAN